MKHKIYLYPSSSSPQQEIWELEGPVPSASAGITRSSSSPPSPAALRSDVCSAVLVVPPRLQCAAQDTSLLETGSEWDQSVGVRSSVAGWRTASQVLAELTA